jgi:hypothetical protein
MPVIQTSRLPSSSSGSLHNAEQHLLPTLQLQSGFATEPIIAAMKRDAFEDLCLGFLHITAGPVILHAGVDQGFDPVCLVLLKGMGCQGRTYRQDGN